MISNFLFSETSPSAAGTATSSKAVQSAASYLPAGVCGPLDDYDSIDIVATLQGKTAGGAATGGTLDVSLEVSPDGGNTWIEVVHFAQIASNAAAITYKATLSVLTQPASAAPVQVGTGTTSALAAATVVQGMGFDRVRLLMVAGSGTTGGAQVSVIITGHRVRVREVGE